MSIQEVSAEQFAQLFHHYHQALANDSGSTDDGWADLEPAEKARMIAAARLALLETEQMLTARPPRNYFAKPGQAEWGC